MRLDNSTTKPLDKSFAILLKLPEKKAQKNRDNANQDVYHKPKRSYSVFVRKSGRVCVCEDTTTITANELFAAS